MRPRGVAILEAIIAVTLACLAFFGFLSVFRSSYQQASMTRNRAVAIILARSLCEEMLDHPYGARPPASWSVREERPVRVVVADRVVEMRFFKSIEFLNQSFIGNGHGEDGDVVTITITWREAAGNRQTGGRGDSPTPSVEGGRDNPGPDDPNKSLVVRLPVWR